MEWERWWRFCWRELERQSCAHQSATELKSLSRHGGPGGLPMVRTMPEPTAKTSGFFVPRVSSSLVVKVPGGLGFLATPGFPLEGLLDPLQGFLQFGLPQAQGGLLLAFGQLSTHFADVE